MRFGSAHVEPHAGWNVPGNRADRKQMLFAVPFLSALLCFSKPPLLSLSKCFPISQRVQVWPF